MNDDRITTAQRDYIRGLMRRAEYDLRTCGAFHRGLAKTAGVPVPPDGGSVDAWVSSLTKNQAGAVIRRLKSESGDGEDDE
jgi:hypothetical protein